MVEQGAGARARPGSVDVGGRRVAWQVTGRGAPLLLLNGYSATTADWDPRFLAALGSTFEVVCPDHRGMGRSELGDPSVALTVDAMADDAAHVLDALGIARAAVAGWSMGGFVAQQLTVRSPARVGALVLLGTDPGGARAVRADPDVWTRLTDHSGSPREQASRLIALLFPPALVPLIDHEFGDQVAAARAALSPAALTGQEHAMAAWHAGRGVQPSTAQEVPVLVICGDEDQVIPPANGPALVERWPGARLETLAGCGHAFMAQEPERVAALVRGFLDDAMMGR